jgi:hypothetical protein
MALSREDGATARRAPRSRRRIFPRAAAAGASGKAVAVLVKEGASVRRGSAPPRPALTASEGPQRMPTMGTLRAGLRPAPVAAIVAFAACAVLVLAAITVPAGAVVPEPTTPVTGNATHFDALGSPYGGCGLPQAELETQNFVALNVYNTPRDYAFYPRPIPPAQADRMGIWNNGRNCGRWVQVRISDLCTGINDGAPGQPFCRNGSFTPDAYNGATLNMLVADSCGDANAWCRDDPYHLDLAKDSLNRFVRNGTPVGDLYPDHWNNRHVEWAFIPAPNYTGDLQIGFLQGAQRWWPAISVSRLANGIHGVEYFADGAWRQAAMNSDMGQSYIIGGTTSGGTDFRIRVRDAADALVNNGRVYSFALPASCASQCGPAYTRVTYTTDNPSGSASASTSASTSGSASASASSSTSASSSASSSAGTGSCAVRFVDRGWGSGYQSEVTVTNTGPATTNGWTVTFSFAGTQRIVNFWGAIIRRDGQRIIADNETYNNRIPAGGSITWGMVVEGALAPLSGVTCTAR